MSEKVILINGKELRDHIFAVYDTLAPELPEKSLILKCIESHFPQENVMDKWPEGVERQYLLEDILACVDKLDALRALATEQYAAPLTEAAEVIRQLLGERCRVMRKEEPMEVTEVHVDEYFCPACGAENNCSDESTVGDAYCPRCGQRLAVTTDEKSIII